MSVIIITAMAVRLWQTGDLVTAGLALLYIAYKVGRAIQYAVEHIDT